MSTQEVDLSASRGTEVIAIGWVFTSIAIVTVSLKLFARVQIVKVVGWDDFFIFLSLAFSIIAQCFVHYAATLGLGKHTATVIVENGMEQLVKTAYWQILGYPFNIGSFSFPNISIAILINRLLDPNPLRANLILGMAILQVIFAIASVFVIFLQCTPTARLWNPSVAGTCWSPNVFNDYSYWVSAYTTFTDIVLAVVPITVFWKLQLRFSTKLGVCIMMGLTLLSAIVTIIKATYLHLFTDRTDPLYNVVPLVLWGLVEQNVVIVAACIPTLRPFFYKNKRSTKGYSSSAMQLSNRQASKKQPSVSEIPLDDCEHQTDIESNNSQKGIWRTRDFALECHDDTELTGQENPPFIVPKSLR